MGTLFLIDAHTPVLLNSEINDTIPLEAGETQVINGSFGVNVPFGVPIDGTPANLTALLAQKFTGLLAYYPGYANITYDEGIDASGWDASTSSGATIGDRGTTRVNNTGLVQSNPVALSSTPSAAILTWELFQITGALSENPKDGIKIRRYEEVDASNVNPSVSFDNGATWIGSITEGVQFSIPAWQQGSTFLIRFANNSGNTLWVGSWAVIY